MVAVALVLTTGCGATTPPLSKEIPTLDQLTPFMENSNTLGTRVDTALEVSLAAAKVSRNALTQAIGRVSGAQKKELQASLDKLDLEIKEMEAKLKAK